ncbi:MAG: hypothetical protein K0S47_509 [Herbinix sp.]|nr:hypothetical protein [Herbinix sp.]
MYQIILFITLLIVSICLYATYQSSTTPKKNILMGVTLPYEQLNHSEIRALVHGYHKINLLLLVTEVILGIPLFFIPYVSFVLAYIGIIVTGFTVLYDYLFKKYNIKLILLKSKQRWFPIELAYRQVTEDTVLPKMKKVLKMTKEPIYVDEDEYWAGGSYYNPNDRKMMVNKRVGAGSTCNMALMKGKLLTYIALAIALVFYLGVILFFMSLDFATFTMTLNGRIVEIDAPVYDYQFATQDIKEITLVDTLPKRGIRANGAATDEYYLGNFILDGYGRAKVYVYRGYSPYIQIQLKDTWVFFNSKSKQKTMECYELLMKVLEDKN